MGFTEGQKQKLLELGTDASEMERLFEDASKEMKHSGPHPKKCLEKTENRLKTS
jgi:hypothetical protein